MRLESSLHDDPINISMVPNSSEKTNMSSPTPSQPRIKTNERFYTLSAQNIHGITRKIGPLKWLLAEKRRKFCLHTENWLTDLKIAALKIQNYDVVSRFCSKKAIRDGYCIIIKSDLLKTVFIKNYIYALSFEKNVEISAIFHHSIQIFIISIHPHLVGHIRYF